MSSNKRLVKTTISRYEFNRVYKQFLESSGKIYCSRCPYHRKENLDHNWYGGYYVESMNKYKIRYPNWKLVSKNKKQWMDKSIEIIEDTTKISKRTYVEIKFSA